MGGEKITKKILVLILILILLATIIISVETSIAAESGINIFRPTGNIIVEWGPGTGSGYTQVDDITPDGTSTYIGTSLNDKKDVYSITSQPISGVRNLTVYGRFITDFIGSKFSLILYKKSTTNYSYSTPTQLSRTGTWETISYTWDTNPFTGANWTDADIEDIGIGICADYCDRNSAIFCTQVYLEVGYFIPDPPSDDDETPPPDDDTNSSDDEEPTIEQLIEQVMLLNLPKRIERRLISKLEKAIKFLNKGRVRLAINRLKAFIRLVERLERRDKITEEDANQLTGTAQQIIDNLRDEIDNNKIKVKVAKTVKNLAKKYLNKC
jgi:hypothetical protein